MCYLIYSHLDYLGFNFILSVHISVLAEGMRLLELHKHFKAPVLLGQIENPFSRIEFFFLPACKKPKLKYDVELV